MSRQVLGHQRRSTLALLGALVGALALLAAACSEPLPDDPVTSAVVEDDSTGDDSTGDDSTGDNSAADSTGNTAEAEPAEEVEPAEEAAADETTAVDEDDSSDGSDSEDESPAEEDAPVDDGSVVFTQAGQPWFLGEVPAMATPADTALDPILIGMINQENTPLGSFPEVRGAAEAAVAFINAELGGVDGRPLQLNTCITSFNAEQSNTCAQELVQDGVVALVGGIDVTSNGSFPVIEQNELAMIGGIPAGLVEQRSPYAFSFSGGGAGGAAAFMKHAVDGGAETVLLAYGEFESFEVAARDYAAVVGESLGLNVELVSFSLFATDYLPVLTKAQEVNADAIILLAADSACVPVMRTAVDLEIEAQLYLTGACAADPIIEAAGDSILGVLFNSEGPIEEGDPEGALYDAAVTRYATEAAGGAGTVGFRGMMNLYGLLVELGADNISSASILEVARASVDRPSFWGHPYTCDGQQVPGLPALCAPQQILFEVPEIGGVPSGVGGWIDTAELFQVVEG